MAASKTSFDKFLEEQMADPEFAAEYEEARREIDSADACMRVIDAVRIDLGMSKAELARRVSMQPAAMRRLLSAKDANPTFSTLMSIADAVGFKLQLVPKDEKEVA